MSRSHSCFGCSRAGGLPFRRFGDRYEKVPFPRFAPKYLPGDDSRGEQHAHAGEYAQPEKPLCRGLPVQADGDGGENRNVHDVVGPNIQPAAQFALLKFQTRDLAVASVDHRGKQEQQGPENLKR